MSEVTCPSFCFTRITQFLHVFGIPMFRDDFSRKKLYVVKFFLILNVISIASNLQFVMIQLSSGKIEEALIFLIQLLHIWVGLFVVHRQRKKVEDIICTLLKSLSCKEKIFIKCQDRRCINACFIWNLLFLLSYSSYIAIRSHSSTSFLDNIAVSTNDMSFVMLIIFHISFLSISNFIIFGSIFATTNFYLVIGLVFEAYSMNFESSLEVFTSKEKKLTREYITNTRLRLNVYIDLKHTAESLTNILPLLWLFYVLMSSTCYFTKIVTEWDEKQQFSESSLVANLHYFLSYLMAIVFVLCIRSRGDKRFKKCIQKALSIAHQRNYEVNARNVLINQELILLHNEIINRSRLADTTVLSLTTFDAATLISFAGHIINFSVMIINIRMAFGGNTSFTRNIFNQTVL